MVLSLFLQLLFPLDLIQTLPFLVEPLPLLNTTFKHIPYAYRKITDLPFSQEPHQDSGQLL